MVVNSPGIMDCMKYLFLAFSVLSLLACGSSGSDDDANNTQQTVSYFINVNVTGLQGSLILLNNNTDSLTIDMVGLHSFATKIPDGDTYSVTVQTQPADQICTVNNASGTINGSNITDISISCANLYNLGGVVTGLSGTLEIQNNVADTLLLSTNGGFTFNQRVAVGDLYNVQISQNPASRVCSIANASGQVAEADITNINILCSTTNTTVSLSGSYQLAPLTSVDSDINDASAPVNIANNTFNTAQTIPNFSTIHGFATNPGTGRAGEGDRFEITVDDWDVYRVELQQNQTIRLQVVDFDVGGVFQGDLDLFVFDSSPTPNQVGASLSLDEYEEVTITTGSAEYYVAVHAYHDGISVTSSSSKYTLALDAVSINNSKSQASMDFIPGEAITRFKPVAAKLGFESANQSMRFSHQNPNRATLARFYIEDNFLQPNSVTAPESDFEQELAQLNPQASAKFKTLQQIKRLRLRDDVEYAEPNYIYHALQIPDDTYYNLQWHYPAINLPQAWDITTGDRLSNDVIVAVVDTGVFLTHPEFMGQLVTGYDFISDAANAADGEDAGFVNSDIDDNPDDPGDSAQLNNSSWHGSHVAGTIAALSDNASGVSGIAWDAKIMPIRVLGTLGGTDYDIIQSIRYAARLSNDSNTLPAQKADIINLSPGGGYFRHGSIK